MNFWGIQEYHTMKHVLWIIITKISYLDALVNVLKTPPISTPIDFFECNMVQSMFHYPNFSYEIYLENIFSSEYIVFSKK